MAPQCEIAFVAASLPDWLKRFSHISLDTIKDMAKNSIVNGLLIRDLKVNECVLCSLGKCKHTSHPTRSTGGGLKIKLRK